MGMTLGGYHQERLTPFEASKSRSAAWPYEEEGLGGEWEVMLAVVRLRVQFRVVLRCRLSINGAISFEQGFQGRRGGV